MFKRVKYILLIFHLAGCWVFPGRAAGSELSETSFLIAELNASNTADPKLWAFLGSKDYTGIEVSIEGSDEGLSVKGSNFRLNALLERILEMSEKNPSKIIPVFLHFDGDYTDLDSLIQQSSISASIFHLPKGEAWPSLEYLIQADRRILFFISGGYRSSGRMLHKAGDYALRIVPGGISGSSDTGNGITLELLMVDEFEQLPTHTPPNRLSRNLVPDYINFLLENWTRLGKRPNFIFVGHDIYNFDFIIPQLNSFTWINGTVKSSGKILEKVYWRNAEIPVTGGRFSFPYRGGDELTLTPFVPGYQLTPQQIIVTGEMEVPENYDIIARAPGLTEGLTGSFRFDGTLQNSVAPSRLFNGKDYSFSQDMERGEVLKLPEDASVNLGSPESYGLRNSSFTVGCFVKFSEILEFGDNAVLGNYENRYRRGLHLILRSGHPYFGLFSNDFYSEEKLQPNIWYHLVWRYIVETGEQAIFLNGRNIGRSDGHPPFSGTGDIHLGSALSRGASLRGYIDDLYFWNRPLGAEEINRLAMDEEIVADEGSVVPDLLHRWWIKWALAALVIAFLVGVFFLFFRRNRQKRAPTVVPIPEKNTGNQIHIFGGFRAVDNTGEDISDLFTPKLRELFLFILFHSLKDSTGASVGEINQRLWPGLSGKKVTNNRAVTLNKLRKLLQQMKGSQIISRNGSLILQMEGPFFCDYAEAFKLCQTAGGMGKRELEAFFLLAGKGRLLKEHHWPWLDEILGFAGNQVIDNLLKLASIYKKENRSKLIDALAERILEYDALNEEAVWFQIWALQQDNNAHQARFLFASFRSKFRDAMGEEYPWSFTEFIHHFSAQY